MRLFTSDRERLLWFWVLVVLLAIFVTLPLSGRLAGFLRAHNLLGFAFALGMFMLVGAVAWQALEKRPSKREVWVAVGVAAVFLITWSRIETPEERTHLIEYGLVAVLIYQALRERQSNGGKVPLPAVLAVLSTALLGWLDEGLQAILPERVYDLRDVGFNILAGLMAIAGSLALARTRRWREGIQRSKQ